MVISPLFSVMLATPVALTQSTVYRLPPMVTAALLKSAAFSAKVKLPMLNCSEAPSTIPPVSRVTLTSVVSSTSATATVASTMVVAPSPSVKVKA